jgi:hypothetical protein
MNTPPARRLALSAAGLVLGLHVMNAVGEVSTPVLKWSLGGCYSSWCETAWYSSPALVDVNGDGVLDVVASAYTVFALNGIDGSLIWRAGTTANRTWPGVVVANLDLAEGKEIVVAQGGGYLSVYNLSGQQKWRRHPTTGELRGLLAVDLDGDQSTLEIAVTAAQGSAVNTWVYDSAGNLRSGWPQLKGDKGYAWGVYNANLAAGDLAPENAALELVVPSDVHYINIYKPSGAGLRVNANRFPGKTYWGQVGVWESPSVEKRGWGACDGTRAESYRANFADGPAVIADVNGDGVREVVAVGNMYDCNAGYPPSRYLALYLFNKNRTRFNKDGFDWRQIPRNTGAPLVEDYNVIETVAANPVVADLDGDGRQEVLYASYDGRLHAFWLDKTEHGQWPYSVYDATEGFYRLASEPVVADLDRDGSAEVIFASWTQKGSGSAGRLHILSWDGQPLHEIDLPATGDWDGALAAPTLGNVDTDDDLEVVVNTAHSGVAVYDLPDTAGANVQWATGRGNFQRTASR